MTARRLALLSLLLIATMSAFAAEPEFAVQPAHPNPGQPVTIRLGFTCPTYVLGSVNGNVINLTPSGSTVCISPSPGLQTIDVGPLNAGLYEVRAVSSVDPSAYNIFGYFTVGDAAIPQVPALDARGIWALALAIVALGVFAIGRSTS
jgi:hypothetical protein